MINDTTEFAKAYSKQTVKIVTDSLKGLSVRKIAAKRKLAINTVRTTVGNLTRGFYDNFVNH